MTKRTHKLAHAAMIAALYVLLTHLQNILFPGTATWAIQCRASEALCVLAFFSPTAIAGLSVGCFLFNMTFAAALPTDVLVGTAATALACLCMYKTRKLSIKGFPLVGLLMPAIWNALLVGWELTVCIGGGFFLNAAYVAAGELIVLFALGTPLYYLLKNRRIAARLFEKE